ncbi:MAG: hypothetical protein AB1393_08565 [Candidatus Edwardsbacteria bacterium]
MKIKKYTLKKLHQTRLQEFRILSEKNTELNRLNEHSKPTSHD